MASRPLTGQRLSPLQGPATSLVVLVHGYGFPNYEGGPLFWASRQDKTWLLAELDSVMAVSGAGFRKGDVARLYDQLARDA